MSIESAMVTYLMADANVTAAAEDHCWPLFVPLNQDGSLPQKAITYRLMPSEALHTHSGASADKRRSYRITCWVSCEVANAYDTAIAMSALVRTRMDIGRTTWGAYTISRCLLKSEQDEMDLDPANQRAAFVGRSLDFSIGYQE